MAIVYDINMVYWFPVSVFRDSDTVEKTKLRRADIKMQSFSLSSDQDQELVHQRDKACLMFGDKVVEERLRWFWTFTEEGRW